MFTQAMPALASSLQGALPAAAVRQLMQVLGNCNQPLVHRGPVAIRPGPMGRESGPAYYSNRAWSPDQYQNLLNPGGVYNNNAFIDSGVTNNHFGGDDFLFNNSVEFITNTFPTSVVIGQPGTPGRDGLSGTSGANGIDGAPGAAGAAGADGAPGAAGRDGRGGRDGRDGFDGVAGPPGLPGLDGLPGRPGRPGRDGIAGGYELKESQGSGSLVVQSVSVKQATALVPKYQFDATECELVPNGNEEVQVNVELDVKDETLLLKRYQLRAKSAYP